MRVSRFNFFRGYQLLREQTVSSGSDRSIAITMDTSFGEHRQVSPEISLAATAACEEGYPE